MKLSELETQLSKLDLLKFVLPDGTCIPDHFHITEIGLVHKQFVDCGGQYRDSLTINFQLWVADDVDHRLKPQKLLDIINIAKNILPINQLFDEVEVEYQGDTIGLYSLDFKEGNFLLAAKQTDCLAKDKCGIPVVQNDCCGGSNCC